jgi:hypothetical protein
MFFKIDKFYRDKRGFLFKIIIGNAEVLFLYTKKGMKRGGDIHQDIQFDLVLKGKMEFRYIDFPIETRTVLCKGTIIFYPNIPHLLIAKENTWSIEIIKKGSKTEYYKPYRDLIK